jgi:hypothetical protein
MFFEKVIEEEGVWVRESGKPHQTSICSLWICSRYAVLKEVIALRSFAL